MKTRLLFLTVLFVTGSIFSISSYAQAPEKEKKTCLMGDLTPEQQKKIETIKLDSDKKIIQYKADIDIKNAELKKLTIAENPSKKDIDLKIDEIYSLKSAVKKERVGAELLIRNELTPEQRVKFDSHRAMKDKEMNHNCNTSKHQGCNPGSCHGEGHQTKENTGSMQHDCQHKNQQK